MDGLGRSGRGAGYPDGVKYIFQLWYSTLNRGHHVRVSIVKDMAGAERLNLVGMLRAASRDDLEAVISRDLNGIRSDAG